MVCNDGAVYRERHLADRRAGYWRLRGGYNDIRRGMEFGLCMEGSIMTYGNITKRLDGIYVIKKK
jgi:hypothetical protein